MPATPSPPSPAPRNATMDNPEKTIDNGPDLPPVEAQDTLPNETPRNVLEGEVFGPQKQATGATDLGEDAGTTAEEPTDPRDAGARRDATEEEARQRESVERGLAQYVFVREEREREVRLTFRDASAGDIARTFRSAGAHLITLSAERSSTPVEHIVTSPANDSEADEDTPGNSNVTAETNEDDEVVKLSKSPRATHQRRRKAGPATGEVLLRYFYSLGEIVYTVSIVSLTGVVTSIASMYPVAARSERELTERLAIVFV